MSAARESADGRYVTFRSTATNLVTGDTNGAMDAFVNDRLTAATTRVSTTATGVQGNGESDDPALNATGRYVVFRSKASNFVANDTNGSAWDIFLKDLQTGTIERISVSSSSAQSNGASSNPAVSVDGRYVVFSSIATNLVAADTNGVEDVFLRDRTAATTIRVSVSSAGVQGNGLSDDPVVSDDGRFTVYQSDATTLVAGDTNAAKDIYLFDRTTAVTSRVSLDTSGAQANATNNDPTISPDGSRVAWESDATNLVAGDDGDGTRFSRQVGAGTPIRSMSDINRGLPVTIDDGSRKYVYGLGLAYAVLGTTIEVYHTDRLGSVRAITDATGAVTATYRTDEWGIPTSPGDPPSLPSEYRAIPEPNRVQPQSGPNLAPAIAIGIGAGAYVIYKAGRMLLSAPPPLWWTAPFNALAP